MKIYATIYGVTINFRSDFNMKLPVAVQLYSVRDDMEKDFYGTIRKMKEFGYDGVVFAGLFGQNPEEIKAF